MKIGMRTIKTAISATLAIVIANSFHLLYPTAAGIIALLSLTNSKRSAIRTGLYRMCSLAIATGIAFFFFSVIGYNAIGFGFYLLIFIPIVVKFKLEEGISMSSVLVTQYLIEKSVSITLVSNAFILLMIGVGTALVFNLYMPDAEDSLKNYQRDIEEEMRQLLKSIADSMEDKTDEFNLKEQVERIEKLIFLGQQTAQRHSENYLFTKDLYYLRYFDMRHIQVGILARMLELLAQTYEDSEQSQLIQTLFSYTSETLSEENDGKLISQKILETYEEYRKKALPKTRQEFENRAALFQLLTEFQLFIDTKKDFSQQIQLLDQSEAK